MHCGSAKFAAEPCYSTALLYLLHRYMVHAVACRHELVLYVCPRLSAVFEAEAAIRLCIPTLYMQRQQFHMVIDFAELRL